MAMSLLFCSFASFAHVQFHAISQSGWVKGTKRTKH
jgi:hypothetical protein